MYRAKWPKGGKRQVVLAIGLDESVYPSVNLCRGERTKDSNQVLTLLTGFSGLYSRVRMFG